MHDQTPDEYEAITAAAGPPSESHEAITAAAAAPAEPPAEPTPVDLSVMSDEDLAAHIDTVRAQATAGIDDTTVSTDDLEQLAADLDAALAESDTRAAAAEADRARREALRARLEPVEDPAEAEANPEGESEAPVAVAASASPAVPAAPVRPATQATARQPVRRAPARAYRAPAPASANPSGARLLALPGNGHFESDAELTVDQLAVVVSDRLNRNQGVTEYVAKLIGPAVAEENRLGPGRNNLSLMERTFSADGDPESRTAAGGLCGMPQPIYDVMTLSASNYRPVARALRSIPADRGAFTLTPGPILSDTTGASDIISEAEDTVGATAPCLSFTCASNRTFEVDKIPVCNKFGNMLGRTNPEMVRAWIQESVSRRDSIAEGRLLGSIRASSLVVTAGGATNAGAWREYFARLSEEGASYRNNPRRRMPRTAPLVAMAPQWMPDKWMADAARGGEDWTSIPTATEIEDTLKSKLNITMTWYADTPLDDDAGLLGANMQFPIQNAGAIIPFPTVTGTALFAPGVWAVADGGEMDFGITRDATSNSTNDYYIMNEIFEQAMWLGPAGSSIWLEHTACATGGRGNYITLACPIS